MTTTVTPTSKFVEVNGLRLHYLDWATRAPPSSCACTASPATRTPSTASPAAAPTASTWWRSTCGAAATARGRRPASTPWRPTPPTWWPSSMRSGEAVHAGGHVHGRAHQHALRRHPRRPPGAAGPQRHRPRLRGRLPPHHRGGRVAARLVRLARRGCGVPVPHGPRHGQGLGRGAARDSALRAAGGPRRPLGVEARPGHRPAARPRWRARLPELWQVLASLPCPTLLLWGTISDVLSEAQARKIVATLPHGTLATVGGSAHAPPSTNPTPRPPWKAS